MHPLDITFGAAEAKDMGDDLLTVIPDDPNLISIRDLALAAYKTQMDDLLHIEPKHRARYLEVAERFLDQAKDAIHKNETLKLNAAKLKPGVKATSSEPTAEEQSAPAGGGLVSRSEMVRRAQEMASSGKPALKSVG